MIIDIFKNKNFVILVLIILLICLLFAIDYFQKKNTVNNMEMVSSSVVVCKKSPFENFGNSLDTAPVSISTNNSNKMQFKVFYTNWCGWSKKALALLDSQDFKDKMKEVESNAEIVRVDCEDNGKEECKQKGINGYPTMILYKNVNGAEKSIEFNGSRTADGIVTFIKENI
jgi:thiol-disulfide isomerase/thioredoxin